MISHKFKCIFIHNRKTGGNSIERTLKGEDKNALIFIHKKAIKLAKKENRN